MKIWNQMKWSIQKNSRISKNSSHLPSLMTAKYSEFQTGQNCYSTKAFSFRMWKRSFLLLIKAQAFHIASMIHWLERSIILSCRMSLSNLFQRCSISTSCECSKRAGSKHKRTRPRSWVFVLLIVSRTTVIRLATLWAILLLIQKWRSVSSNSTWLSLSEGSHFS